MKIKCGNCKKHFDTEKYGDFCPHCGMFINEDFNLGKTTKKQWGQSEAEMIGQGSENQKKRDWVIYVGAVAFVILLGILIVPMSRLISNIAFTRTSTGAKEPDFYEVGEVIEISGHTICITDYEWNTENGNTNIPEGYDLLRVDYKAENLQDESITLDSLSHIYLKCDGQYIKAEMITGYHRYIGDRSGTFSFMVPENAKETELLVQIQSDNLKWKSKLIGNFVIPIER